MYADIFGWNETLDTETVKIRTYFPSFVLLFSCHVSLPPSSSPFTFPSHPQLTPLTALPGVTNNVITSQVAGGVLRGLFPGVYDVQVRALPTAHKYLNRDMSMQFLTGIQVHVQPEGIDSLEPQYPCAAADDVRAAYTTGDNGTEWQDHLNATAPLFAKLDAVSEIEQEDDAGWHTWFDQ